ncbi:nickel ABC transporter substrate-binding protein [Planomonospora parontospora subsp. parontospora]|uniref:Nickel ABC transporter substrate-binding protein n=2 Tax=Planomonospora parontospora TaxID=58119 RepID=A0AA37BK98_9ACTN|nr:ABC transporter substrate-binding protein [Planomonospora parontospora]GGK83987.1 nickel ABC transporter substrate-binding protein [Planomonospora parontospora]GII10520.1 nickel ABC transporter substrate-binding protein [Planomonospora parontospora subsp. parontospora]
MSRDEELQTGKARRAWIAAALALIVVVGVTVGVATRWGRGGENTSSPSGPQRRGAELVIAVGDVAGGEFDPLKGWGSRPAQIRPIHSSLLTIDADVDFVGDLASEYSVSDDARTWSFTLRDNARWSNGEPVTARDVVFTYEMLKKDGTRFDLTFVDRITATGESRVEFHLKEPRSTFVSQLSEIPILPAAHYGPDYSKNPIGSGPYTVADYQQGQQLILTANPHWYGQRPRFTKLTFLFLGEDAALAAARAGTVDIAYVPPAFADQRVPGMTLQRFESIDSRGLSLPTRPAGGKGKIQGKDVAVGNDVTADPAIRKALNIGLDRDEITEIVLQGHGRPAHTLVDTLPWFNREAAFEDGRADDAERVLAEAGWRDSDGDGIVEKAGKKAGFTLMYPSDDKLRSDLALVVAEQARTLGIEITAKGGTWDGIYLDGKANAVTWGGGRHHAHQLYSMYSSKTIDTGYNNMPQYADPTVDGHLDRALSAATQEEANEHWKRAQWDGESGFAGEDGDAPIIWLVRIDHLYLVRDGLHLGDQPIHGHGHEWALFNTIAQWRWEK